MSGPGLRDLSCAAKLARVVLEHCGPLCPSEVADEANVPVEHARTGLAELAEHGFAEPVCGVRADREEVYALTAAGEATEPDL